LRRRLYGILYRLQQTDSLSGTYIVVAKPNIKQSTRKELPSILAALIQKTNL